MHHHSQLLTFCVSDSFVCFSLFSWSPLYLLHVSVLCSLLLGSTMPGPSTQGPRPKMNCNASSRLCSGNCGLAPPPPPPPHHHHHHHGHRYRSLSLMTAVAPRFVALFSETTSFPILASSAIAMMWSLNTPPSHTAECATFDPTCPIDASTSRSVSLPPVPRCLLASALSLQREDPDEAN